MLEIEPRWCVEERDGFTWWGHRLAQRAWAEPGRPAIGREGERVLASTRVLDGLERRSGLPATLSALNRSAVLGAWLHRPGSAALDLVSIADLTFGADWREMWWILAATLQLAQAEAQAEALAAQIGGQIAVGAAPIGGLPERPAPGLSLAAEVARAGHGFDCPLTEADFSDAAFAEDGDWLFPVPDARGLGAILPLNPDQPAGEFLEPAHAGHGQSLPAARLRLDSGARHPALGSGSMALLRLPDSLAAAGAEAEALAAALNLAESEGASELSLLGAWSADDQGLAYTAFIPTLVWLETDAGDRPERLTALLAELAARTAWASTRLRGEA